MYGYRGARDLAYFVLRSPWNVIGFALAFAGSAAIWHWVEAIQLKMVLAAACWILLFFGCVAIGIKREYREEDEGD